jgi:cell division ATPase FtsA
MNVAIPENYRMLNIALVDVGAGTSDLCITKDGSIAAYGMIPYAGDELTEVIVQAYLVDFATAEQIKLDSTFKDEVTYTDIMGISHTVKSEEVWNLLSETREKITKAVAEKIIELNGDKPVAATFVVGGGGKVHGFCPSLAKKLGIVDERVALRGEEAMNDIIFDEQGIEKDPLLVTPIGICLNYYEQRNSFIMVHFNDEMLKIYDNGRLTVFDAAIQAGLDTTELFPKRGAELNVTVNGIVRLIKGIGGESAEVRMDGEVVGLNTPLKRNSYIEFRPSTMGSAASAKVADLAEYTTDSLYFVVNQKRVACPKFVEVNGILESPEYELKDGDKVDTRNYYTVGQLAKFMDVQLNPEGDIFVNNKQASLDTLVYENFSIDWETLDFASMDDSYESGEVSIPTGVEDSVGEADEAQVDGDLAGEAQADGNLAGEAQADSEDSNLSQSRDSGAKFASINVKINGNSFTLTGKKDYIFVDIFTVYPFNTNESNGRAVYTMINSSPCGYVDPLKDGDSVEIGWKEK